jgi:hypothetical protein
MSKIMLKRTRLEWYFRASSCTKKLFHWTLSIDVKLFTSFNIIWFYTSTDDIVFILLSSSSAWNSIRVSLRQILLDQSSLIISFWCCDKFRDDPNIFNVFVECDNAIFILWSNFRKGLSVLISFVDNHTMSLTLYSGADCSVSFA